MMQINHTYVASHHYLGVVFSSYPNAVPKVGRCLFLASRPKTSTWSNR